MNFDWVRGVASSRGGFRVPACPGALAFVWVKRGGRHIGREDESTTKREFVFSYASTAVVGGTAVWRGGTNGSHPGATGGRRQTSKRTAHRQGKGVSKIRCGIGRVVGVVKLIGDGVKMVGDYVECGLGGRSVGRIESCLEKEQRGREVAKDLSPDTSMIHTQRQLSYHHRVLFLVRFIHRRVHG
jgi:hypothetical protein